MASVQELDGLLVEDVGSVRHIRFNKPQRLNALADEEHELVIQLLGAAASDPGVHTVAFSGEGRAFSSGADMGRGGEPPARYLPRRVDLDVGMGPLFLHEAITVIRNLPKPTVALMHGYALGAGYDYATSCDFRLATEDARIGDPRVHRALWAAEGWAYKTSRLIAQTHMSRMHYLGEHLTGQRAWEIGFVHRVFPEGSDIRDGAQPFLDELTAIDPETFARTKRKLLEDRDLSYRASLAHVPAPAGIG